MKNEKITKKNSTSTKQEFKEAFSVIEHLRWSKEDLLNYSEVDEAVAKARRQQMGAHEEGIQKEKEAIAIKMLKKHKDIVEISDITDLTIDQIQALKKKL